MNPNKGAINLIIGVVVTIALVLGGGYYVYEKTGGDVSINLPPILSYEADETSFTTPPPTQPSTPSQPSEQVTPPANNPSSGWQIYKNEKYGFEISHPQWMNVREIFEPPTGGERFQFMVSFSDQAYPSQRTKGFDLKIYDIPLELTDKDIAQTILASDDYGSLGKNFETECLYSSNFSSMSANNEFTKITTYGDGICFRDSVYFFSMIKNGYLINVIPVPRSDIPYVGYNGEVMTANNIPEFNQILSSFKFIN